MKQSLLVKNAFSVCAATLCEICFKKKQIYKSFRTLREKFQKASQKRILRLQGNALSSKKNFDEKNECRKQVC